MKKVLCLVLVMIVVVGLLAGCGKSAEDVIAGKWEMYHPLDASYYFIFNDDGTADKYHLDTYLGPYTYEIFNDDRIIMTDYDGVEYFYGFDETDYEYRIMGDQGSFRKEK